jgi:hypothetical protein
VKEEAAKFWDTHCVDCGHDMHPMDVCSQIVGGDQDGPDYCPCALDYPALAAAYHRAARTPEPGLRTALDEAARDAHALTVRGLKASTCEGPFETCPSPYCTRFRAALSQPAEAAELRAALLQAMDEAQPDADNRGLADRVVELMSDSDEAMQR